MSLYAIFHLNLAYSSIEEERRPEVVARCYWPLLRLARKYSLPFGIEAPGYTLEAIDAIDPTWTAELRRLTRDGPCEFIGSGYAQAIGPLLPEAVNVANLRLGNEVYERLLGDRPRIALVNEQAYSAGLVGTYLDAGYEAIVMEWDNPAQAHPEWPIAWRYVPQRAVGADGREIGVIWNKSLAFQKFQRYAHAEMDLDEYLEYLEARARAGPAFPLYGNDVEVFDFRPGRYHTEAEQGADSEWARIDALFEALRGRIDMISPSDVLALMKREDAGHLLRLETADQPVPVKKQGKYNLTRWAVTGRDDVGINTKCNQVYEGMRAAGAADAAAWRELCYLWSSDFRTHITQSRWSAFRSRLDAATLRWSPPPRAPAAHAVAATPASAGRLLTVATPTVRARFNQRRGLALDALWFPDLAQESVVGTLPHGYFDDIDLGADFYSGQVVFETPARPKITDLNPTSALVEETDLGTIVRASIPTSLGPITKTWTLSRDAPKVTLEYVFDWIALPVGSFRLGHMTLIPTAFDRASLAYATHNGGPLERYPLAGTRVDHGRSVSFLVSARTSLGATEGLVELSDAKLAVQIRMDRTASALVPMLTFREAGGSYFCRVSFSAREVDETVRGDEARALPAQFTIEGVRRG